MFINACGYRGTFLGAIKGKQTSMVRRYKVLNGKTGEFIPASELVKLARVYLMTGFVCWYCGEKMYVGDRLNHGFRKRFTVDHRKPLIEGGTNHIWNLVYCCYQCNVDKNTEWQIKKNGGSEPPDETVEP